LKLRIGLCKRGRGTPSELCVVCAFLEYVNQRREGGDEAEQDRKMKPNQTKKTQRNVFLSVTKITIRFFMFVVLSWDCKNMCKRFIIYY